MDRWFINQSIFFLNPVLYKLINIASLATVYSAIIPYVPQSKDQIYNEETFIWA